MWSAKYKTWKFREFSRQVIVVAGAYMRMRIVFVCGQISKVISSTIKCDKSVNVQPIAFSLLYVLSFFFFLNFIHRTRSKCEFHTLFCRINRYRLTISNSIFFFRNRFKSKYILFYRFLFSVGKCMRTNTNKYQICLNEY